MIHAKSYTTLNPRDPIDALRDLREFRHKNEAASSRAAEEARAAAAEIAALRAEVARRTEVAQRLDNGQHDSEIKVRETRQKNLRDFTL